MKDSVRRLGKKPLAGGVVSWFCWPLTLTVYVLYVWTLLCSQRVSLSLETMPVAWSGSDEWRAKTLMSADEPVTLGVGVPADPARQMAVLRVRSSQVPHSQEGGY